MRKDVHGFQDHFVDVDLARIAALAKDRHRLVRDRQSKLAADYFRGGRSGKVSGGLQQSLARSVFNRERQPLAFMLGERLVTRRQEARSVDREQSRKNDRACQRFNLIDMEQRVATRGT